MGKLSAAIPFLHRIKHSHELEVNHFLRGSSHSSPSAEEDISNLQESYHHDEIHVYKAGRKVNLKDKLKNIIAIGSHSAKLWGVIANWQSKWDCEMATEQKWELEH
jgi:hypothetical protein